MILVQRKISRGALATLVALAAMVAILVLAVAAIAWTASAYRRSEWRHWTDADGDCQDARQEVLIAESLVPVTLDAARCRVMRGQWLDVYGGEVYTDPKQLDVDHLVSLGAAHRAGGWRWNRQRKMEYANYQDDPWHLIAVSASLNRQKSDKGPAQWLPPRVAFRCSFVNHYAQVAVRWNLRLPQTDRAVIAKIRASCGTGEAGTLGFFNTPASPESCCHDLLVATSV